LSYTFVAASAHGSFWPEGEVSRARCGVRFSPGLCCKTLLSISARNIDSRSNANTQQRFKRIGAPIRLFQISISQSPLGDFRNRIEGGSGLILLVLSSSGRDPGCVKTSMFTECRKYNSPARYRADSAQDCLASSYAVFPKCFYVRRAHWSFHATKTLSRHHRRLRLASPMSQTSDKLTLV